MPFIDPSQLDPQTEPTDLGTIGLSDQAPIGGSFITETDLDPLPAEHSTWDTIRNETLSIANKGVEGIADLASLVQDLNPLQPEGPRLFGYNPMYRQPDASAGIKDAARAVALYGDEKAQTPAGRIAGQVAYFAPGVALPGGGLAGRAASAIGGGLASGLTREVTDNPKADFVASILGGLAPGAAAGLGRSIFRVGKMATPEAAAIRALEKAGGDEIRGMRPPGVPIEGTRGAPASTFDPFYSQRTLAEELQSPKLAQLQDQLAKRSPEANEALVNNEAARRGVHEAAVESVSQSPIRSAETGGQDVRALLQGESDKAFEAAVKKGVALPHQELTIPIDDLRTKLTELVAGEYRAGGVPKQISGILSEIQKPVEVNGALTPPREQAFAYVHDLRDRVGKAWKDFKDAGHADDARVADLMRKHIDDAIELAPQRGGTFSPTDVNRFMDSKAAYSESARTFREGTIGTSLERSAGGGYALNGSSVAGTLFNGTADGTRRLLKALPPKAEAVDNARGAVRDLILRHSIDNDGNIGASKFRTWIRQNREALTAEYEGRRLFDPEHIDAVEQVADDLGLVSSTSERSVKNLANRASKGQPTTAQALFMGEWGERFLKRDIPGLRSLVETFRGRRDAILSAALISNKELARALVAEATPQRVSDAAITLAGLTMSSASQATELRSRKPAGPAVGPDGPSATNPSQVEGISQGRQGQLSDPTSQSFSPSGQARSGGLLRSGQPTPPRQLKGGTGESANGDLGGVPLEDFPIDSPTNQPILEQALNSLKSGAKMTDNKTEKRPVAEVEQEIDQDPYYSALYEAESSRNPKARPVDPKTGKLLSSAKGGFQFLDGTAKLVKLKDPDDLGEAFEKVKLLTEDHKKRFGDDPEFLYSAHYLGATVLNKVVNGKQLTRKEQQQVDYLKEKALPRFMKIYSKVSKRNGQVEA